MFRHEARQIELLNRVGQVLGMAGAGFGGRGAAVHLVRQVLEAEGISLWTCRQGNPAREFHDWADAPPGGWETTDGELALGQFGSPAPGSRPAEGAVPQAVTIPLAGTDDRLVGALQLFGSTVLDGFARPDTEAFLRSLGGMMGQFVERRQLELGATLLREVHHRVKNNLHTIASVLRMQLRRLDHVEATRALEESIHRIQAIALVHDTLSRAEAGQVDLMRLAEEISRGFAGEVLLDGESLWVDAVKASPLALIINELIQNAVDHGSNGESPWVRVTVRQESGLARLLVADRGPGWPTGFSPAESASLGLTIVTTLADEELRGTVEFRNEGGAIVEVRFPLP